ncbi:MAG: DUF3883 domain-containing protein, partial [Gemmatimonadaceae bacterium]
MPEDWSVEEVEATVADYFAMLTSELRGESYSKADHNSRLRALLRNRSRGSVEFKHANISAVLIALGYPYIDGYRPRSNYQDLLRQVVEKRLCMDQQVAAAAATAVEQPAHEAPEIGMLSSIIVPAPVSNLESHRSYERRVARPVSPRAVNYLELEAHNASLGAAGEDFVLRVEHARLWQAGRKILAERIVHASRSQGDWLGYDIVSFEEDGRERLIEVKTTRFGAMTPFFTSQNQVDTSAKRAERYHLYRVFK